MAGKRRLLGLDPGLRRTGWGLIEVDGHHLRHLAHGTVTSAESEPLSRRLLSIYEGLSEVIERWAPDEAAVEQTFVSKDAAATLKLGQARAVALLAPALAGIDVAEYAPNFVKKAVVGSGHAQKGQIRLMIRTLLPGIDLGSSDAADALAVAICHAHQPRRRAGAGDASLGAARSARVGR